MIAITRSLARTLRAVFRKLVPRSAPFQPQISLHGSKDGLNIRLHRTDILAQHHVAGEFSQEEMVLPCNALADFEGRNDDAVTLEITGPSAVQARWNDTAVPQIRTYVADDPAKLANYPATPEKMTTIDSGFLPALAEVARSADREAIRYAVNNVQIKGGAGIIVATDGKQLLLRRGFSFPWNEDVLVPASAVYACRELQEAPCAIGKNDNHVVIQTGSWTLYLPIDKDGRFPPVETVIPKRAAVTSHCRLTSEDRQFLARSLARLPGGEDEYAPVTVDLNGQVCVRARADGQEQVVELLLARSEATGKPIQIAINRRLLDRALKLGLEELHVLDAVKPLLFQDEKRQFVAVPLQESFAVPPNKQATRISSLEQSSNGQSILQRRIKTVAESNITPDGNGALATSDATQVAASPAEATPTATRVRTRKPKSSGIASQIEEAEALRNVLRDLAGRAHKHVVALKRQRKQSRLMQSTLASLKQLQHIDG